MKKRYAPSEFRFKSTIPVLLLAFLVMPGNTASIAGKTYTSLNFSVASFVADQNFLWIGTYGEGLVRVDKKTGETSLLLLPIPDFLITLFGGLL
jgi:hypothetical protein